MIIDISTKIGTTSNQGGFKGLLDVYSGAAAAYSLRKLSKATTSVVRVRRDSDNAEADFTAQEITDGTLAAFCTGTDGLVTTWYDQSGNGNDATQGSAAAQPKIVDAGVLVTENGKASIDFDGTDDNLNFDSFTSNGFAFFHVSKPKSGVESIAVSGGDDVDNRWDFGVRTLSDTRVLLSESGVTQRIETTDNYVGVYGLYIATQSIIRINGSTINTGSITNNLQAYTTQNKIGARNYGVAIVESNIHLQEIVIYPTDQSTNRSGIESRINNYYNIY